MGNRTDQAKYSAYLTIDELELITSYRMVSSEMQEPMRRMCEFIIQEESKEKSVNVVQLHK